MSSVNTAGRFPRFGLTTISVVKISVSFEKGGFCRRARPRFRGHWIWETGLEIFPIKTNQQWPVKT